MKAAKRLLHLLGRLLVALIVLALCYPFFSMAYLIVGDPRWRSGVPIWDFGTPRTIAALAGWAVLQGLIIWRIDRWVRR